MDDLWHRAYEHYGLMRPADDLWTEAYLARYPAHSESGIPKTHPLRAFERFRTDPRVVYTQHRVCSTRMGQGALVVTEPHSELNAGLIVIFRSSHPPLFDWYAWSIRFRSSLGSVTDEELKDEASNLAAGEGALDSIWFGGFAFDGHVFTTLLGLLPGMGIDW